MFYLTPLYLGSHKLNIFKNDYTDEIPKKCEGYSILLF